MTFPVVLAALALAASACSSGAPDKTSNTTSTAKAATDIYGYKLKRQEGKADVKNVTVKTGKGNKVSLSSPAPGHEIIAQYYNAKAAKQLRKQSKKKGTKKAKLGWSKPTTIYSSDTSYCSAIDVAASAGTVAASVTCSALKTERTAANASVVLATNDLKTWKTAPLPGVRGVPTVSPSGTYASFSGPHGFLIWSPKSGFAELEPQPPVSQPPVGAVNDDGTLIMVRSKEPNSCVIWLLTATPSNPTPKGVFTSRAIPGQPNCTPLDAKLTKHDLKIDLQSVTTVTKKKHKKTKKKTFTAYFTQGPAGGWSME